MTHSTRRSFHLLLTGKLPNDELEELQEFSKHLEVPDYVWGCSARCQNAHPMTMFNTGILSMQSESVFYKKFSKGMAKAEYWEAVLDDGIRLLAKLPSLAAGIYRMRFKGPGLRLTLAKIGQEILHMVGLPDKSGDSIS